MDLDGGAVPGFEALLRAEDAAGALVPPSVLFPAAEAAGWTNLFDRVGRTTALHDAGAWLGARSHFINSAWTSSCSRSPRASGSRTSTTCPPSSTTTGPVAAGVAIDDLGAGYSSLDLLVRLQPDVVKLDKDIVQALPEAVSLAVVTAVVSITHADGGRALAECVETAEQAAAARDLGVDLAQGWYFGRPTRPQHGASGRTIREED